MNFVAVIPARYAASRFPGKLLQPLGNRTVLAHTYLNTVATGLFREVLVVTDSDEIEREIHGIGGKVLRSSRHHESGTDRIAEIAPKLEAEVIVNVQGDEPFVRREPLERLCRLFNDPTTQVGSLMHLLTDEDRIADPNTVKVVVNMHHEALYFSRSPIPFRRDAGSPALYYKHIGVYGYRKEALLTISQLPTTLLEQTEKLEQLRMLEHGYRIRMALTEPWSVSIDTPDDLEAARQLL
ncbi:MAG TPA: 3-deoxy-manno-octulosonate cytidylyltransferase [Lacibacter sp.]|nr:3-deoxy-manno-octulosonate cytidylyltransferase [Lacibacter sp.]HMO90114.1 3-deoxy-manno-octulosonate cytidylyltransferase [Lacibacter sp.]HMP85729.1 3-deoxy-manno-octulosonate cytidylyltransferase [Lacibacter sp.]